MTPRDVDELSGDELQALWEFLERDLREQERAGRKAARGR